MEEGSYEEEELLGRVIIDNYYDEIGKGRHNYFYRDKRLISVH